jgi:hypothetical protein
MVILNNQFKSFIKKLDNTQYIEYNIIKKGGQKMKDTETTDLINLTISIVNLITAIVTLKTATENKKNSSKKTSSKGKTKK